MCFEVSLSLHDISVIRPLLYILRACRRYVGSTRLCYCLVGVRYWSNVLSNMCNVFDECKEEYM